MSSSTRIVPEIVEQLSSSYGRTQRELARNLDMPTQAWDEAKSKLDEIDISQPTVEQFVSAFAVVSTLQQVLVAVAARGDFAGGSGFATSESSS